MKSYKKFASEFIKLQIQVFLMYQYVQGISLGFKHEHDADYDKFRKTIVESFDIRVSNLELEKQFYELLQKLNLYRKIHSKFAKNNILLRQIWNEPYEKEVSDHGFQGWYRISELTRFNENLKSKKTTKIKNQIKRRGSPIFVSEFIHSRFQDYLKKPSQNSIDREMILLGMKKPHKTKSNSQNLYSNNYF